MSCSLYRTVDKGIHVSFYTIHFKSYFPCLSFAVNKDACIMYMSGPRPPREKNTAGATLERRRVGDGLGRVCPMPSVYNYALSNMGVRGLSRKVFEILHANLYILVLNSLMLIFWQSDLPGPQWTWSEHLLPTRTTRCYIGLYNTGSDS